MKTVVIVGAGPAGLTAAYQLLLQDKNCRVIILEQDVLVGGISKTAEHNGNRMDLGGHRFFTKSKEVRKIWEDLLTVQGVPIAESIEYQQKSRYPGTGDPNICDDVMLLRRRISRIYYNECFFDYPVTVSWETLKKLGFFKSFKCAAGYLVACIRKRKGDSLEDFYINRFGKPLYELFFKDYTTKLWGVSPAELDSSWGAQRVKKLSLSKVLLDFAARTFHKNYQTKDTSLIEEFYYPKFGPGQMWQTMSRRIEAMGGEIRLNTVCQGVLCRDKQVYAVKVTTADGRQEQIDCDYVISSMPVKELVEKLDAPVPEAVSAIAQALPYRDFVTVGILVDRLALKNGTELPTLQNIPPDCWIYVQDSSVKMGRIQLFNNWSPFLLADPGKTVWLGLEYFCHESDAFWNMPDEEIRNLAVEELRKMKLLSDGQVIQSVVLRQKKAYPAYFGAYQSFDMVKNYLLSFPNLLCVGRNGQHRYNNMDHSMITGIRAAQCVCDQVAAGALWDVNTEQEYHEEE